MEDELCRRVQSYLQIHISWTSKFVHVFHTICQCIDGYNVCVCTHTHSLVICLVCEVYSWATVAVCSVSGSCILFTFHEIQRKKKKKQQVRTDDIDAYTTQHIVKSDFYYDYRLPFSLVSNCVIIIIIIFHLEWWEWSCYRNIIEKSTRRKVTERQLKTKKLFLFFASIQIYCDWWLTSRCWFEVTNYVICIWLHLIFFSG